MVEVLKKFIVEMIPSFVKKIFVEVEANNQEEAIELAIETFNENKESINFNSVVDYEIAARTEATHRSLINARHQKKNKKKISPSAASTRTAIMIHAEKEVIQRLGRFQEWWRLENGKSLSNAAALTYLMMSALKKWESNNAQMDLLTTIAGKKKVK